MSRSYECPKCGTDIGDSYEGDDPSVGISAGYYCDACDLAIADGGYEAHDDDVQIFGTSSGPIARCPKCLSTNLEMGYGLAGGGMGPYSYCPTCGVVVNKSQDPT
jgi:hypothetical protein